jgi:hypothetical protein
MRATISTILIFRYGQCGRNSHSHPHEPDAVVPIPATVNISPSTPETNHAISRFDDLIPEESENVQKAIKRLPAKEAYDRVFRIRRAFQVRPKPPSPRTIEELSNITLSIAVLYLPHSPSCQRADQARGGEFVANSLSSKIHPPRISPYWPILLRGFVTYGPEPRRPLAPLDTHSPLDQLNTNTFS